MKALAAVFAATTMLVACSTTQADKDNAAANQPPSAAQAQPAATTPAPADAAKEPTLAAAEPATRASATSAKAVGSSGAATAAQPSSEAAPAEPAAEKPDAYRELTIPAGTVLHVTLDTPVASDTSRVEQPVNATLSAPVSVDGVEALPAGTEVTGHVTAARRPGRVKGRGYVAMRFTNVDTPGEGTTKISTAAVGHLAPATKQKDTLKIVAPAAGAAVLGRVVGGKSGARKGAVIGGAAGTGYVLATRGEEARLGKGAKLAVKLTAPLTVRVKK
jgi:hypothetical protein